VSITLTILCYGLSNTVWCEAADAEDSATSTLRITAIYRIDLGGFNLGSFHQQQCSVGPNIRREAKGNSP
jgi:hypothetical protein